ncbi:MAG: serpin family protein [Rhodothermales bacterium]
MRFVVVLCLFTLGACDAVDTETPRADLRSLSSTEQRIVEADNTFGFNLFRQTVAAEPEANVFISPLSVSMALGMTLNGAEGETREEMEATLELVGLDREAINASYASLIELLQGLDPSVAFSIANSVWYREGFEVLPAFTETNRAAFDAEVRGLDFGSAQAPAIINDWVKDQTNQKIEKIIEGGIHPLTVLFLINAIHFKGDWTYTFDTANTLEAPFRLRDGRESTVDMMVSEEMPVLSYWDENLQAVELSYGDSLYAMTLVMPHDADAFDTFVQELDADHWNTISAGLTEAELTVGLPRFKQSYEVDLNDALKALGMPQAFDPAAANFSSIHPDAQALGMHISKVKHKTFVEVNEEGTEATAVTSVEIRLESAPIALWFDRPFVYVIRERHTGSVLFVGQMQNPAA